MRKINFEKDANGTIDKSNEAEGFNGDLSEIARESVVPNDWKQPKEIQEDINNKQQLNDVMIRDSNPKFQENIEKQLMSSLQQHRKKHAQEKLINWHIYNAGKQTIIVL